jgi:hypothetical protein
MNKQLPIQIAMVVIAFGALISSAAAQAPRSDFNKPLIWSSHDRKLYAADELPPERSNDFATEKSESWLSRNIIIDMDLRQPPGSLTRVHTSWHTGSVPLRHEHVLEGRGTQKYQRRSRRIVSCCTEIDSIAAAKLSAGFQR